MTNQGAQRGIEKENKLNTRKMDHASYIDLWCVHRHTIPTYTRLEVQASLAAIRVGFLPRCHSKGNKVAALIDLAKVTAARKHYDY